MNRKAPFRIGESDMAAALASPLLGLLLLTACSGTVLDPDPSALDPIPPTGAPIADAPSTGEAPGAASGAAAYADDPEAVARGRGLFRAVCTGYCHTTRPADRVAPDLFDCSWARGDSDPEIFRTIRDGVADTQMLGFGGKLPEEDLWKIVAYLRAESKCGGGAG